MLDVALYGFSADEKRSGNILIAVALSDALQDFDFSGRQTMTRFFAIYVFTGNITPGQIYQIG